MPPPLSGRLAGCGGVIAPSSSASGCSSPVVQRPGHCYQLGEVGLPPVHSCSISGHADRDLPREGVSV